MTAHFAGAQMVVWVPLAVLPNLSGGDVIEGDFVAIVPFSDTRVQLICGALPLFADFASRFTDAFGVGLEPSVFIARGDYYSQLNVDALLSFRDIAAISVITYSRSLNTVYNNTYRIAYSNSFNIYPWTLSKDFKSFIASTPAFSGFHVVGEFHGQSSPELPVMPVKDIDTPLFDALLVRWKKHYFGKRPRWKDRALFRSLNMAVQAAALPANTPTIFDLGRSISLWVSAFEILSHPRTKPAGLLTVYPLFEGIAYCDRSVGRRKYAAYMPRREKDRLKKAGLKQKRHPLPCWIYGHLYQARNNFLHGNRVTKKTLSPKGSKNGLFWLSPSLYRLALTGCLELSVRRKLPYKFSDEANDPEIRRLHLMRDRQCMNERALLRVLQ